MDVYPVDAEEKDYYPIERPTKKKEKEEEANCPVCNNSLKKNSHENCKEPKKLN